MLRRVLSASRGQTRFACASRAPGPRRDLYARRALSSRGLKSKQFGAPAKLLSESLIRRVGPRIWARGRVFSRRAAHAPRAALSGPRLSAASADSDQSADCGGGRVSANTAATFSICRIMRRAPCARFNFRWEKSRANQGFGPRATSRTATSSFAFLWEVRHV